VDVPACYIIGRGVIGEAVNHCFWNSYGFGNSGECVSAHVRREVEADLVVDLLYLPFWITMKAISAFCGKKVLTTQQ